MQVNVYGCQSIQTTEKRYHEVLLPETCIDDVRIRFIGETNTHDWRGKNFVLKSFLATVLEPSDNCDSIAVSAIPFKNS